MHKSDEQSRLLYPTTRNGCRSHRPLPKFRIIFNIQDASLYGHGLDPIELIFGLFAIPGRDQMLGFVQKHRAQSQSPKFFLIHITHFRVIGVPGGCLASSSLFLDEMFSSSYIHFDVPIKGGFSQECQPFLIEIGAVEQFSIGGGEY